MAVRLGGGGAAGAMGGRGRMRGGRRPRGSRSASRTEEEGDVMGVEHELGDARGRVVTHCHR
jgi:hypothetical protein